jgi:2',3'-cyclic-nucleotide 2'-phosphodiesterase (5'-nucleotidase family)
VVTVLHTTDTHGAFEPGLVQCASIIRQACAENPCHVVVDGGDFASGSAEVAESKGRRAAEFFGLLGYDAAVLGNHDFDWGVEAAGELVDTLSSGGVPVLAANFAAGGESPEAFQRVIPYIIKDVEGIRVAVVGLTTPNLPNWFRDFGEAGLRTESARAALERVLPRVRAENPDILVVVAHQGLLVRDDPANEINAIGEGFPEIDLLLGGHLHWVQEGAKVGRVDYGQSGSHGRGVMRVDIQYDTTARKITGKTFRFVEVEAGTPVDGPAKALVREDCEAAARKCAEVVAQAPRAMAASSAGAGLCPLQQLLAKAMVEGTGADAAMQGTYGNERLSAGEVTMGDVWRLVPYENRVGTVLLTAEELRLAMEDSMDFWGTPRYVPVTGVAYDLYPNAPKGERVRNLRWPDGRPIHWRARIKVAANSYLLAGAGGRFPALAEAAGRPEARLAWCREPMRALLEAWLRRRGVAEAQGGADARVFRRERRPYEREDEFEHSLE